jgi:O-antigen/teichoic acid export membrane protein
MLIRNTAANLAGQLLYPVLALVLVPFYLRHLGLEGYGLIGVASLIVSLLSVLSRGLGSALQREIGRRHAPHDALTLRRLVHSIEVWYWALGGFLAIVLGVVSVTLGPRWVKTGALPPQTVSACLLLLAIRVSVAFPHSVYQSVFIGTERQVLGNMLNAALALTSATCGVLAVLLFDSVVAFYASETITAAAYVVILRSFAFRVLPVAPAPFDPAEIRGLLRISVALMWTSGVGLLLSSLDRLVVSTVLPVAALGIYTVAVMGGRFVMLFFNPFLQAAYPRMCQLARSGSPDDQASELVRNTAVISVAAAGIGVPLSGFAPEVLTLWVRDATVVRSGALVTSIYVIGSLLIAFASVCYQWQTAIGRTDIAVKFNAAAVVWFPVVLWVLVARQGLVGAAIAWVIYGGLAWGTNLFATFGRGALPIAALREYLRLSAVALAPAVLCTIAGRVAANMWFPDALWLRAGCGALAGACSGIVALLIVLRRFQRPGIRLPLPAPFRTGLP